MAKKVLKEGVKYDQGKPRWDLLPPEALLELVKLYTIGAAKYEDRNWEKGMEFSRVFRALLSHAFKWWAGEDFDTEDGQHHMDSVAWNALGLRQYQIKNVGTDNRPNTNRTPVRVRAKRKTSTVNGKRSKRSKRSKS